MLTGLLEPTNEPCAIAKIAGIKMCDACNRQCLFAGFRDVARADNFFSAGMPIPPSRRAPAFFAERCDLRYLARSCQQGIGLRIPATDARCRLWGLHDVRYQRESNCLNGSWDVNDHQA